MLCHPCSDQKNLVRQNRTNVKRTRDSPDDQKEYDTMQWAVALLRASEFGLRNAAPVYPSGLHLQAVAAANCVEKVHRAAVALEWLERLSPGLPQWGGARETTTRSG